MDNVKIYTYSIVRSSIEAYLDRIPYCAAILERPNGSRFPALLAGYTDGMDVHIGMPVRAIKDGDETVAYSLSNPQREVKPTCENIRAVLYPDRQYPPRC